MLKLGKHESIDYVLVGTGCRIYVVYVKILAKKLAKILEKSLKKSKTRDIKWN